jgi:hypothetical protein
MDQQLLHWLKGNIDAVRFCEQITAAAHLWDDLIDQDRVPTSAWINEVFQSLLVDIPRNPFYSRNFEILNAIIVNAINQWHAANELESTGDTADRVVAFVVRSTYADLIVQSAMLLGGREWAAKVAVEVHRRYHREGLEQYLAKLDSEPRIKERRHGVA